MNYALGRGVTLLLITPSLHTVDDVWGKHHPFLEGCGTKMVFGIRDGQVAERFLDALPDHTVLHRRTSWTPNASGWGWRKTIAEEEREEPLVSRSALLNLAPDKVLARVGGLTVILTKAYYKHHRVWRRRSRLPVPEAARSRGMSDRRHPSPYCPRSRSPAAAAARSADPGDSLYLRRACLHDP